MSSRVRFNNGAAPSTPSLGKAEIFVDSTDKRAKQIDDAGVVRFLADGTTDENFLINGGFDIAQRQVPTTLTTLAAGLGSRIFSADRWFVSKQTESGRFQQVDTIAAVEVGMTARNYGKFVQITGAGKQLIGQPIESINMACCREQVVRVQFKMKYTVAASMTVRLGLIQLQAAGAVDTIPTGAGTFITNFQANGTDPTLGANLAYIAPIAGTAAGGTIVGNALTCVLGPGWIRFSASFTVPTDAKNLIAAVWTNSQLAINDELNLAEAGLYGGYEIKDWTIAPILLTLRNCQRYYVKTFLPLIAPAQNAGVAGALRGGVAIAGAVATSSVLQWRFPSQLWKTPAAGNFTSYNPSAANAFLRNVARATDSTVTTFLNFSPDCVDINATGLAAWTVGDLINVNAVCDCEM